AVRSAACLCPYADRSPAMLSVTDLELRVGARMLMSGVNFRVGDGDKVGLVGRNGAGKTTMTRVLAGEGEPTGGSVRNTGSGCYLPQDPRTGDLEVSARDRILSARGIGDVFWKLRKAEADMSSEDELVRQKAMRRY